MYSDGELLSKRKGNKHTVPIDEEIKRLRAMLPEAGVPEIQKRNALARQQAVVLPRPDLYILHQVFRYPVEPHENKLLVWLRSVDVLLLLRQWKEQCLDTDEVKSQMDMMLHSNERPWTTRVAKIADHAIYYGDQNFEAELRKVKWAEAFVLCANFGVKIVKCNGAFFESLGSSEFSQMDKMKLAVTALLTVYDDVGKNKNGFFGTLLDSPLAKPMAPDMREQWEAKYLFNGEGASGEVEEGCVESTATKKRSRPLLEPSERPQKSSRRTNEPTKPTRASHNNVSSGKKSRVEDSDGGDATRQPGDAAAGTYQEKAAGLYDEKQQMSEEMKNMSEKINKMKGKMNTMSEELRQVKAQRDSYKGRLDESEAEQRVERTVGENSGNTTNAFIHPDLTRVMQDANVQLSCDNAELRKALGLSMRGKSAPAVPNWSQAEELTKALLQAGYKKPN